MTAKKPLFHADVQAKIVTGVNTLARAVSVTLGPKARTVVIERAYGAPTIINSGVVVAASVAGLILATHCMIAQLPEPTPNAAMAPEM